MARAPATARSRRGHRRLVGDVAARDGQATDQRVYVAVPVDQPRLGPGLEHVDGDAVELLGEDVAGGERRLRLLLPDVDADREASGRLAVGELEADVDGVDVGVLEQ